MKLSIFGAGGHAKSIFDIIVKKKKFFFFDDQIKNLKINQKKYRIVGNLKFLIKNKKKYPNLVVGIGNNKVRIKIFNLLLKNGFNLISLIHSNAYLSPESKLGIGSVIMAGSVININSKIGNNCIINTNSSIDHDCFVDDHTHICPGVTIAGNVNIGKNCWIGMGSKIIENITIKDNVFVAAGSLVLKDIKSNSFVKGNPAEYVKKK